SEATRGTRASRKSVSMGPTRASRRDYALPSDLVEVLEVSVDGMPYGRATHTDLSYGAQGWLLLDGIGGVIASEETASGDAEVALYPTPTQAGLTVTVRGIFR